MCKNWNMKRLKMLDCRVANDIPKIQIFKESTKSTLNFSHSTSDLNPWPLVSGDCVLISLLLGLSFRVSEYFYPFIVLLFFRFWLWSFSIYFKDNFWRTDPENYKSEFFTSKICFHSFCIHCLNFAAIKMWQEQVLTTFSNYAQRCFLLSLIFHKTLNWRGTNH